MSCISMKMKSLPKGAQLVIDTSYFLTLRDFPNFPDCKLFSTPEVLEEIKDRSNQLRIDVLITTGSIRIESGRKEVEKKVVGHFRGNSNFLRLSRADLSVLVLAKDLHAQSPEVPVYVAAEDFEIQNIAVLLGLRLLTAKGATICETRLYVRHCVACNNVVEPDEVDCSNCGSTRFRQKVSRRTNVRARG